MKGWLRRSFKRVCHEIRFTDGQRRVVAGICVIAMTVAAWRLYHNPVTVPDPQAIRGDRYDELADRIDPNTAEAADLATLPTLGEKRAKMLVDWRTQAQARDGTMIVFRRPEDLYKVKGIGPGLVEQMRPYLIFPASTPIVP